MKQEPSPSLPYEPVLDGIRGIAILLVVGYHVGIPGLARGFVGVDIFFALSGFLIVGLLALELDQSGRVRWAAFYARRARRLLPALIVMTSAVAILGQLLLEPVVDQPSVAKQSLAALVGLSNWYFLFLTPTGYFDELSQSGVAMLHTWSLGVEEQFYLGMAVVILVAVKLAGRRRRLRSALFRVMLAITLLSLGLAVLTAHLGMDRMGFYSMPTRAYEFGIGALVALSPKLPSPALTRGALAVVGTSLLGAALTLTPSSAQFPSAWGLLPAVGTAALILSARSVVVSRMLGSRPLVRIGQVSYAWYLWHFPLLALGFGAWMAPLPMPARALLALVALGIAFMSERWVELPFRRRTISFVKSDRSALVASGVATALVAGGLGVGLAVSRHQAESSRWTVAEQTREDWSPVCPEETPPASGAPPCTIVAASDRRPVVVLWGDSHVWHLIPAFEKAYAGSRATEVVLYISSGCPPFVPTGHEKVYAEPANLGTCITVNRAAWQWIRKANLSGRGVHVVLSAAWDGYDWRGLDSWPVGKRFGSLMQQQAAVAALGELGVPTTVLLPTPEFSRDPTTCRARSLPFVPCHELRSDVVSRQREARDWLTRSASRWPTATVVDPIPVLCGETTCPTTYRGRGMYIDDDHLSSHGARRLATFLPIPAHQFTANSTAARTTRSTSSSPRSG